MRIGPRDRPPSKVFFDAYSKVSYDVWKKGTNPPGLEPQRQANGPWEFIGGSVGKLFGASDPSSAADGPTMAQHTCDTCAARLSWALNHCLAASAIKSGVIPSVQAGGGTVFRNDPNITYGGKAGDAMNYIVGAPAMHLYLTNQWGPPDTRLSNLDVYATDPATGTRTRTSEGDASALRAKIGPVRSVSWE